MSTTQTETSATPVERRLKEPWIIWAGILAVVVVLVLAVVTMGVQGLVVIMVPAALAMLVLLCFIVFG